MSRTASITRRLTLSVFLLQLFAALVLISAATIHEQKVRFESFETGLRATSNALLGAVQESDTQAGGVGLDVQRLPLPRRAVFAVTTEGGGVLAARGAAPSTNAPSGTILKTAIAGQSYRFYVLVGERVIDPGRPTAITHRVSVVYGLPEAHTWSEIAEAARFFTVATFALLGLTTFLLWWSVRHFLAPIRSLALEAEKVDAEHWAFVAPPSSKRYVELRPLATAIETTVGRLQRSFEQQRRFTSDAAHELKTDLAIIKSSVQLLAMKRRTPGEYDRGLALSLQDIARLETTAQRMLTLARFEQGPRWQGQSTNLSEAVREALAQTRPYADAATVRVEARLTVAHAPVRMSQEDALLLCANVLMNAYQHSPSATVVEVSLTQEGPQTVLRVRDHGRGIAEADKPFLFDAFYRGDVSRSRDKGGTGLGLSICKAICNRADGVIAISNHPEGGAEVEVRFPAEDLRTT